MSLHGSGVEQNREAPAAAAEKAKSATVQEELVLLIVENHRLLRSVTADCLAEAFPGCRCIFRGSGEGAVQAARSKRLDAILMDIGLPGIDGIEATRQIRLFAPRIPVVMLTGHREDFFRHIARAAGASGYVLKEAMYEELAAVLSKLLAYQPIQVRK